MVLFGYILLGKRKLGVRVTESLEIVQSYQTFIFGFPLLFQRRILLYDFSKNKYYDFDDKLENRLLKLGKKATSEQLNHVIKQYEKEGKERINYYEMHKDEIGKKDNQEFIRFLKGIGILFLVLILIIVIKWIFF